jgi:peroxiredoxin-like protein
MGDLSFNVELSWSGTGREGVGAIQTNDLTLELSGPGSMGGRGVGASPEELLVSAVSSCYIATLFGVLRRAGLPVGSLAVSASGTVTGFPGDARFARIVVSPTVLGGDITRHGEYEAAALVAHDRCLIGRTLAPEVAYEVGPVQLRDDASPTAAADQELDSSAHDRAVSEDPERSSLAWRAA